MRPNIPIRFKLTRCFACAAVIHSSMCWWVINNRTSVRHDGVRHQPGLVGEERRHQTGLRKSECEIGENAAEMAAFRDAFETRIESRDEGNQCRERDHGHDKSSP